MVSSPASLTGPARRFGDLVGRLKGAIAAAVGRDHATLGPLAVLLWNYLARSLRRFAALQARHAAGTLRPPRTAPRIPKARASAAARIRLPRGAVLARFDAAHLSAVLEAFVAQADTRALLAATPEAGRLLRPLWRMLTTEPLPETLRPPPEPVAGSDKAAPTPGPAACPPKRTRGLAVAAYVAGRRRRPPPLTGPAAASAVSP